MHTTPDKILPDPNPQLLHDMHHEDHCHPTKEIIGKCTQCQLELTTQDIVIIALNRWKKKSTGGNHAILREINAVMLLHLVHWHMMIGQGNVY
eukprot:4527602-Ditylum_brightwellii.AAC.1